MLTRSMAIGMATKKVTITLDEAQLKNVQGLVASGKADSVSRFVQHAVAVSLADVAGWGAMLGSFQHCNGIVGDPTIASTCSGPALKFPTAYSRPACNSRPRHQAVGCQEPRVMLRIHTGESVPRGSRAGATRQGSIRPSVPQGTMVLALCDLGCGADGAGCSTPHRLPALASCAGAPSVAGW